MEKNRIPTVRPVIPTIVAADAQYPSQQKESDALTAHQKFELAKEGLALAPKVIDLVKIWMEAKHKREEREGEKEQILNEIRKIDAEAENFFRKAEGKMLREKEITERLRDILNFLIKAGYPAEIGERIITGVLTSGAEHGS